MCPRKLKKIPLLLALPVELLNLVCDFLVEEPSYGGEISWRMLNLRLTCKALNERTYDYFSTLAFTSLAVRMDISHLQTLVDISNIPAFAEKVQRLLFSDYDDDQGFDNHEDYTDAILGRRPESMRDDIRDLSYRLKTVHAEADRKDYIERSENASPPHL